jgi:transposase
VQVGSYFGLIPSEHSSGGRQQLGRISKQGSSFLRFLLVEAGQSAARHDAELGRFYRRLAVRKHRAIATVQGRCAGEPESFCGGKTETDRLSGQPASPRSGEFER